VKSVDRTTPQGSALHSQSENATEFERLRKKWRR